MRETENKITLKIILCYLYYNLIYIYFSFVRTKYFSPNVKYNIR